MRTAILLVALLLAASGCRTLLTPTVTTQPVSKPAVTNTVIVKEPLFITNTVAGTVVTNYAVVTNTIVTPPRTEVVTVTNWVPNPAIIQAIDTAKTANAALNPTPSEPIVNWALTGLSALLGVAAAWKNRKVNALQTTLDTVIQGVETAPPGIGLDNVKSSIAKVAAITGVSSELDTHVQRVSAKLAKYLDDGKLTAEELVDLANDATVSIEEIPQQYRATVLKLRA